MASGQRAANSTSILLLYLLSLCADAKLLAFTSACESASFKVDPILVQNLANPTPTVLAGPTSGGNRNGAPPMAACGISGLAFVWGVTMLLL